MHQKCNFETAATFNPSNFKNENAIYPKNHQSEGQRQPVKSKAKPSIDLPGDKQEYQDDRQPLLCLDIKISINKTEQLMIFENDDIERVTQQFALIHSLPEHKREKLLAILKKQVLQTASMQDGVLVTD